jgi:hypothetical protein
MTLDSRRPNSGQGARARRPRPRWTTRHRITSRLSPHFRPLRLCQSTADPADPAHPAHPADSWQITPAQFHTFVTSLNAHLSSAYSLRGAVWDNLLAIASWWTSLWWHTSQFEKVSWRGASDEHSPQSRRPRGGIPFTGRGETG